MKKMRRFHVILDFIKGLPRWRRWGRSAVRPAFAKASAGTILSLKLRLVSRSFSEGWWSLLDSNQ